MPDQEEDGTIWMESGISVFDRQPFVALYWGDERCQMSPAEVRAHALRLLETAEAAESDALLYRVLDRLGLTEDERHWPIFIMEMRRGRAEGWPDRPTPPPDVVGQ